jgi:selenide,water dikinase
VLAGLPQTADPRLLVGFNTADDAGVFALGERQALIQTVDFFTPIVDDPYAFGAIAAANALSDVYAMGGEPLTCLNIVCFPCHGDLTVLGAILRGGAEKVAEAGAVLVGGHTIQDDEPKYGLAVTGLGDPERLVTNAAARPGDRLILTKPLGTGIIATAIKGGAADQAIVAEAVRVMSALNRDASRAMVQAGVKAATDITGFGLVGHALELAEASRITLAVEAGAVPLLPGVRETAELGLIPAGAHHNREYALRRAGVAGGKLAELIFCGPETSGGLLIAVPAERAEQLLAVIRRTPGGEAAALIGEVRERGERAVVVV